VVDIKSAGQKATTLAKSPDNPDTTGQLGLDLGGGNDTLKSAPWGTVVTTGDGADDIRVSDGIGITDLSASDRITIGGVLQFHGGLRYKWSESPWATSYGGLFKSGINGAGELQEIGDVHVLPLEPHGRDDVGQ